MASDELTIDPAAPQKSAVEAKPSVAEAKRRFLEAMHEVDLLEPLRKHPYVVVGSAVTAGAVLGSSGKVVIGLSAVVGSLARMIKPIGGLVAQLAAAKLAAHTAVQETKENRGTEPEVAEANGESI